MKKMTKALMPGPFFSFDFRALNAGVPESQN